MNIKSSACYQLKVLVKAMSIMASRHWACVVVTLFSAEPLSWTHRNGRILFPKPRVSQSCNLMDVIVTLLGSVMSFNWLSHTTITHGPKSNYLAGIIEGLACELLDMFEASHEPLQRVIYLQAKVAWYIFVLTCAISYCPADQRQNIACTRRNLARRGAQLPRSLPKCYRAYQEVHLVAS